VKGKMMENWLRKRLKEIIKQKKRDNKMKENKIEK
jgi:hypothetical protein